MPVPKPFRRTCRQLADGSYAHGGHSGYIDHPKFATSPQQYVRAFLLIQKDLLELFDYVEPADKNRKCYSYRIHELLTRVCIEVEANCKAILHDNGYVRSGDWNMGDYKKLEATHRLSDYVIKYPLWNGGMAVRRPFASWATASTLSWYEAYNTIKHDRHREFEQANFRHLTDAVAGLVALLGAQFYTHDFSSLDYLLAWGPGDGFETAIGSYFLIKHPEWPVADRYDFDWQTLKNDPNPFDRLAF